MKTILLTKGMVALVDDSDFNSLNKHKWHACECNGRFYARRDVKESGTRKKIYMHRVVMPAGNHEIDHSDGCTLNNQKSNLRLADRIQNMGNCRIHQHNTSGFKGVGYDRSRGKFMAYISNGLRPKGTTNLGRFQTAIEAAQVYDQAALKKYGKFARTNKMMGLL